jgi:VWFA-related protein
MNGFFPIVILGLVMTGAANVGAFADDSSPKSLLLVAVDTTGATMGGIQQKEFSVEENGKSVQLSRFEEVSPKLSTFAAAPTGPGTFTNRFATNDLPALNIVVLDTVHTRFVEEGNIRAQILNAFREAASQKQALWLLMLTSNGLRVVHDYRLTFEQTLDAIREAETGGAKGGRPASDTAADKTTDTVIAEDGARLASFARGEGANPMPVSTPLRSSPGLAFQAMQEIADATAGIRNRKSLVWISATLPFEVNQKDGHMILETGLSTGAPVGGNVQLSSTRALVSDKEFKAMDAAWLNALHSLQSEHVSLYPIRPTGVGGGVIGGRTNAAMESLAAVTGGRSLLNSNDVSAFIAAAGGDSRHYYELGYPDSGNTARGWQRLNVKSARDKVRLLAPSGLYVGQDSEREVWLRQSWFGALNSQLGYTGVAFTVKTSGTENTPSNKRKVAFTVFFPPTTDTVDDTKGQVNLDLSTLAYDTPGKEVSKQVNHAGGPLDKAAIENIRAIGIGLDQFLELLPGNYTIKMVVRNNLNGRIGTIAFPTAVK